MKQCFIIPTYNEAENIRGLLERIIELFPDAGAFVVDDNSPDGTADIVRGLQGTYPNLRLLVRPAKEGLGTAYLEAFGHVLQEPDLEHVIMMDADGSHDPASARELIRQSGSDAVVIGSRYVAGGRTENWELWRRLLSRAGNAYSRIVAGLPVRDCTSGFLCIPAPYLRKISARRMHASGYAFLIELKFALLRAGATLKEVPITFANRSKGASKISSHIISEGVAAPWLIRFRRTIRS
jgi:dolichol-phosphate mannosyltransferase